MQKTTTEKHIPSPPSQGEGSVALVHSEPSVENPTVAEHVVTITDQEMQENSRIVGHVECIEIDIDDVFEQGTEILPEKYTYFGHIVFSVSFGLVFACECAKPTLLTLYKVPNIKLTNFPELFRMMS